MEKPRLKARTAVSATDVGAMIRRSRKARGLTQRQLAKRVGISEPTIRGVERGTGNPTLEVVFTLLEAVGVKMVLEGDRES